MELVPFKVTVQGKRRDGNANWPEINDKVQELQRGMSDWAYYVDSFGIGMCIDKTKNIGEGCDCEVWASWAPKEFVDAAVGQYDGGSKIERITEAAFKSFYDDSHACYQETEKLDTSVLQGIAARKELEDKNVAPAPSTAIKALRKRCLDPNDPLFGIRKNHKKTWALLKAKLQTQRPGQTYKSS